MRRGREILADVARSRRIKVDHILGACRLSEVVKARHEICRRCRRELNYSLNQIGRILNIHHTSVLYAVSTDHREKRRRRYHAKRKAEVKERA